MSTHEFEPEAIARQLGADGVDNLVVNAERICGHEKQRITLSNEGTIFALKEEFEVLRDEERRIETLLISAPPSGDLRRLRRRAIYCWTLTTMLTLSGLAFTLLTLAPFRLGSMSWLFAVGIAALTPFLVEKLLERNEMLVRVLNAAATVAAVAGLMLLAEVRGNLLEQQLRQNQDQAVVIDGAQAPPQSDDSFYTKSDRFLQLAMLFLAFSMEVGAGLALREAWRSSPNASEDWRALRHELAQIRGRKSSIIRTVVDLRNAPGIFVARFWRDFYRAMLSNAVRGALTRLMVLIFVISLFATAQASAEDRTEWVIAIDLSRSVAVVGPDGKSEFQKNVDGVSELLAQIPAGARVTVIGITDRTFSQPYILMTARTADDPGYFGERLNSARRQLAKAWELKAVTLTPHFKQTDILGALRIAVQIFDSEGPLAERTLILLSDMRQSTPELDLESPNLTHRDLEFANSCEGMSLRGAEIYILGADGAGRSNAYWRDLHSFWQTCSKNAEAHLADYSVLRLLRKKRDTK